MTKKALRLAKRYKLDKFYNEQKDEIRLTYEQAWNAGVLYNCTLFASKCDKVTNKFGERYIVFKAI